MTTFQSREAVRDELVSLFVANGSWQTVYGYFPAASEVSGRSPFLVITSAGTQQNMAGMDLNPAAYRFSVTSYVVAYDAAGNWGSDDAEDKVDALDRVLRQVVRDNAGAMTTCDLLNFDNGFSQVIETQIEGVPYKAESRTLIAELPRGAK